MNRQETGKARVGNRHSKKSATRALNTSAISVALAFAMAPPAAHAQAGAAVRIDIPAQSLNRALLQLGQEMDIQLYYLPDVVEGLNAPAVSGSMTPDQALQKLLAGTGIQYHRHGKTITLSRPASSSGVAQLPEVTVVGTRDSEAERVNPPTTVGWKTPLTLREIPQSVTVIPHEQIEQQDMKTLNDAVRYTPGMSIAQDDSERTTFYSRGFPVSSWMLDGLPTTQNLTSSAPNLAMFDRVEVLRGPDGLMNGFGSEGGAINLVRKRAPSEFGGSVELSGGNYSNFGQMLDLGGPLNGAGTVRGRIVASNQTQDLPQDTTWRHDKLLYGTLEADITPDTKLRIGGSVSEMSQKAAWVGVPVYSTPVDGRYQAVNIPRSAYLGAPWNDNAYYNTTAFAELDQNLGSDWKAKIALNYLGTRDSVFTGGIGPTVDPTTNETNLSATHWNQWDNQESIDAFLSGPVQLFGRKHQLTLGTSYQHESLRVVNHYCGSGDSSSGDLWCDSTGTLFSAAQMPMPAFNGPVSDETTTQSQYSLYGNARISLADPLTLVVGARAVWWKTNFDPSAQNYWGDAPYHRSIPGKIIPYAGLIYDLNSTYSLYASYTTIFNPQSAHDYEGNLLAPLEGVQYETGIKGEYLDGKLNTSLALFQLTEQNRAMDDPRFPAGSGYSIAQGRARSQGVELTATGQVTPSWMVSGGYTYTQTRYLDGSTNATGIGFSSVAPKHLFKLWTNYRLPGSLNQFSVGGGAYVSSGTWAGDGNGSVFKQGTYAVFDLRLGYQVNKRLSAALNVTNLFNRRYFSSIENVGNEFYGNPRQIMLTLRYAL